MYSKEAKRTFFPLPTLRFPSSVSQCCLFMDWYVLWVHLLKAHYVPGTAHGAWDLSGDKTKIPALEEFSPWGMGKANNSILEGTVVTAKWKKGWAVTRRGHYSQILNLPGDENVNFRILPLPFVYDHSLTTHHTSTRWFRKQDNCVGFISESKEKKFQLFSPGFLFSERWKQMWTKEERR